MMLCCLGKNEEETDGKKNRPRDHIFCQQRLPAWQPLLNARSAFPIFLIIGIIFIPVGAYLFVVSESVQEESIDYTHCWNDVLNKTCSEVIANADYQIKHPYTPCVCSKKIKLESAMKGEVLVYYGLTNFYQNHRRYVRSRDDQQLIGRNTDNPREECEPFRFYTNGSAKHIIGPCGAIANSIFNDTFKLVYLNNGKSETVGLGKKNIAWTSDVDRKFGVMPDSFWKNSMKPPNWPEPGNKRSPGAFTSDEELIVWMRTAALPTFRKLHRRLNHSVAPFEDGLPAGDYILTINYSYPVTAFAGSKRFILSTTSWIGGKNATLGIAYMVVGCIHLVVAFIFILLHVKTRKRNRSFQLDELQTWSSSVPGEPQLGRISSLEADQEA